MKHIALALGLVLAQGQVFAQEADDFQPAQTNVWDARYPQVASDGRVRIRKGNRNTEPTTGRLRDHG